ncbi:hypothetical protein BJX65DRAFT_290401 [Aspergillus insuetus]
MGGILSRLLGLPQITDADRAEWERQRQWEESHPAPPLVPPEADEGAAGIYAWFADHVKVVLHKDRSCLVAYAGEEHRDLPGEPNPYEVNARDVNEFLLRAVGVQDPAENGGLVHPWIVKYLGRLTPGFKLEFVSPGPLEATRLPVLPVPITNDTTPGPLTNSLPPLLRLYYRWALQTLSALHFLHTHAVYISDLCASSVWIRSDLSAALTGFVSATLPSAEYPSAQCGCRSGDNYLDFREVEVEYDPETGNELEASPRADICDWATLFWRLLTNECSVDPPPGPTKVSWPMLFSGDDQDDWPVNWDRELERERLRERRFQRLEEARMGDIFVKAWCGEYNDVGEVIADLRALLEKMGVEINGKDEILPGNGKSWEDIFVVIPPHDAQGYWREIRLRESGGLDSRTILGDQRHVQESSDQ